MGSWRIKTFVWSTVPIIITNYKIYGHILNFVGTGVGSLVSYFVELHYFHVNLFPILHIFSKHLSFVYLCYQSWNSIRFVLFYFFNHWKNRTKNQIYIFFCFWLKTLFSLFTSPKIFIVNSTPLSFCSCKGAWSFARWPTEYFV